jgi:uncharacterized protein (TIGR03437 family)
MQDFTLPVAEYSHAEGCSVTGGFIYRGRLSPGLRGIYIYGDYCSGRIWGIEQQGQRWVSRLLLSSGFAITTFGEDEAGEVYVANAKDGTIYRIEGSGAPRLNAAGVVNGASFAPGLTPGSLATVFVAGVLDHPGIITADRIPLPSTLGGVSVIINGILAPLDVVSNVNGQEQVNFQVPFEIVGQSTASIVVMRGSTPSSAVNVPVIELQPAIYTIDGTRSIIVHNADFTLVTPARPLESGESAFLYAAGLGRVGNQPLTGSSAPRVPLASALADTHIMLGGFQCEVQYAGLAPDLVGVYQVSFRVPTNAPSGLDDLLLMVGAAVSPVVKVPVK